ncbi:MAG: hypothetical protein ACLUGJ_11560 [Blautia wexlerae]
MNTNKSEAEYVIQRFQNAGIPVENGNWMIGAGERTGKQMDDMDLDYKYVSGTGVFPVPGRMEKEDRKAVLLPRRIYDADSGGGPYFLSCSEILNFILFHKRDGLLNEEELSFVLKRVG